MIIDVCTNKVKFYFKKLINPIAKTLMQNIEEHLFDADIADTGAPVGFKTMWGHQYMVCIICSPGVNRVKVAAITWWGPSPHAPMPTGAPDSLKLRIPVWCTFGLRTLKTK